MRRLAIILACAAVATLGAAAGKAAIVSTGGVELTADGEFTPHELPRRRPAPIVIDGSASLRSTTGGPPPQLEQAIVDFDRDGLLTTAGLPTCSSASVEKLGTRSARRKCGKAVVGTGEIGALVLHDGEWLRITGELTLFNGPPAGGLATVIAHAQPVSLPDQIYVVTIPIQRTHGDFRYRATVEVPEIFEGAGVLTRVRAEIGRRYRFKGRELSYASARCSDGTLGVHGRFTFANGVIVDGTVEKYCVPAGVFNR